jgi:hypothetical protein
MRAARASLDEGAAFETRVRNSRSGTSYQGCAEAGQDETGFIARSAAKQQSNHPLPWIASRLALRLAAAMTAFAM